MSSSATETAARLAALLARRDAAVARHEAEYGADGDASARRPAGNPPRVTQGQNAPGDSDRQTSVAGAAHPVERPAGNTLNGRQILDLDAATVARLHPDSAAPALATSPAPGAATSSEHVGPAVDDALATSPESAGDGREPADLAVALGSPDLIDDGVGVVVPFERPAPAWAAVAGTELARSTEAPPAADAVYARAGPNRCAPSSPRADFDACA